MKKYIFKQRCIMPIIIGMSLCYATLATAEQHYNAVRKYIKSSDNTNISYIDNNNINKPAILFIHGFSQSAEAWSEQFNSALSKNYRLLAIDLRGHGYSEKPEDPKKYASSQLWADDIATIIKAETLDKITMLGWSYGGLPMLDYIDAYGQNKLSNAIFVATGYSLDLRPPSAGGPKLALGPGVLETLAPMANIQAGPPNADLDGCAKAKTCETYLRQYEGTRKFLSMVPYKGLSDTLNARALAYNMQTPPFVRRSMVVDRFMISGPLNHTNTLKALKIPTLIIQGNKDQHILPSSTKDMYQIIASGNANTTYSLYENIGHAPFLEASKKFNQEISDFISKAK